MVKGRVRSLLTEDGFWLCWRVSAAGLRRWWAGADFLRSRAGVLATGCVRGACPAGRPRPAPPTCCVEPGLPRLRPVGSDRERPPAVPVSPPCPCVPPSVRCQRPGPPTARRRSVPGRPRGRCPGSRWKNFRGSWGPGGWGSRRPSWEGLRRLIPRSRGAGGRSPARVVPEPRHLGWPDMACAGQETGGGGGGQCRHCGGRPGGCRSHGTRCEQTGVGGEWGGGGERFSRPAGLAIPVTRRQPWSAGASLPPAHLQPRLGSRQHHPRPRSSRRGIRSGLRRSRLWVMTPPLP